MISPEESYSLLEVDIGRNCSMCEESDSDKGSVELTENLEKPVGPFEEPVGIFKCRESFETYRECTHKVKRIYVNEDGYLHTEMHTLTGTEIYEMLLELRLQGIQTDPAIISHFEWYKIEYITRFIRNDDYYSVGRLISKEIISSESDLTVCISPVD